MRELFDAELNLKDKPFSRAALEDAVGRAEVLVPTITDTINGDLLSKAGESLKMIANFGAGVDHIDVEAAVGRGLIVTNTPGVLTEDTADLAMGLILAVSRRLVEGAGVVQKGEFSGWTPTWMCGRKLWGKRLGIIGMGRIGQALARRARAFGMQVHYHNRKPLSPMIVEDLRMDIISLNCPATRETHHLMDARRLGLLAPHAILINTARGDLIDEAALAAAVGQRALGGVGLDVFEKEPLVHSGLLNRPEVVLMPHLGSATLESRQDMGDRVIANIMTFQNGHRPPDRVIPAML